MLIDTHCHLDFPDFEAERDAIVARAHEAGVEQMITISTRVKRFETILSIAEAYPNREVESDGAAYRGPPALYADAGFVPYREMEKQTIVRLDLGYIRATR